MSFVVRVSLDAEVFEVQSTEETTLGNLKNNFIKRSGKLGPGTLTSDLKAWTSGGTPMVDDGLSLADYNMQSDSQIVFGFDYPEDVRGRLIES